MDIKEPLAAVRQQLAQDGRNLWGVKRVHFDAPKTDQHLPADQLPQMHIVTQDMEGAAGVRSAGCTEMSWLIRFQIVGRFAWPTEGTLEQARVERANAILQALTADSDYVGARFVPQIKVSTRQMEVQAEDSQVLERRYDVMIEFSVEIVVSLR